MRRIASLTCALACLVLPASASAAVTPDRDEADVAAALTAVAATPSWTALPPAGNPAAVGNAPLGGFPTSGGTFAVLSSGDAAKADPANTPISGSNGAPPNAGGPRPSVWDLTTLRLDATVPANVNCAVFSFRFYTDEAPGNGSFNDGFIAELDGASDWTADSGDVSAPNNFAFDVAGNVISVNSPGSTGLTPSQAAGTNFQYATARLTAATPITPGAHTLFLSVFDQGDGIVDSAVFLDGLGFEQRPVEDCVRGAQDEVAPTVTLTQPANGATTTDHTPTFGGAAGDAPGDAGSVSVEIRSGGSVVQTLTTTRSGTAWSVASAQLGDGTYSARAIQLDEAGNVGVSATRTFTVTTPQPTPIPTPQGEANASQSPQPVLGETVVAGKVGSGTVRIKLKNGKFRTLGANEAIPLGSTIDATKGKVRVTAAAGAGGAVQTADFYKGAFVITQTGGSKKPVTQLALSGKLSCPKTSAKKKAKTSARKKVRRLWGDGKGRFRTRGRHGAATVRGTKWLTEDRCDSTKISVKRGTVVVRDFAKKKNKVVKKGHSYVARAKPKK